MASKITPDDSRAAVADGFATVREAEGYLNLSRATIYTLMDGGDLKYAKFGRSRRIPWTALREYAAKSMVGV